jgi:hypothetical protein
MNTKEGNKGGIEGWVHWFMPLIPTTWEVEIEES